MPWDGQLLKSSMTTVAAAPDGTLSQTFKRMVIKKRGRPGAGGGEGEGEGEGERKAPGKEGAEGEVEVAADARVPTAAGFEGPDGLMFIGDLFSIAERELAADAYSRYCVLDSLVGWAQRFANHADECEALCQELQGMGRVVEEDEGDVGMEDERIEVVGALSTEVATAIEFLTELHFGERAAQVRAVGTKVRLPDLVNVVMSEQPTSLTTTLDTLSEDVYEVSRPLSLPPPFPSSNPHFYARRTPLWGLDPTRPKP